MEVAVNNILQVLNKEAIAKVKVILKRDKKSHQSKHEIKTKANQGVDPLRSPKEGKNNQDTTSEVIHNL